MFTCERMCYNINEGQRKSKKDGDEMSVLSNRIESFIKELMTDDEPTASIQRNELADYFKCAPSQINYVLTTRFSPDRGYIVESRRGGGGYVKIIRVSLDKNEKIRQLIESISETGISERLMRKMVACLSELGYADEPHARSIYTALCDRTLAIVDQNDRDRLRGHQLKQILYGMLV